MKTDIESFLNAGRSAQSAVDRLTERPTGRLELEHGPSGARHWLCGRAVHCGVGIEIQLGGERGPWVPVRYEANLGKEVSVCLHAFGGRIYYDNDARFRWPL